MCPRSLVCTCRDTLIPFRVFRQSSVAVTGVRWTRARCPGSVRETLASATDPRKSPVHHRVQLPASALVCCERTAACRRAFSARGESRLVYVGWFNNMTECIICSPPPPESAPLAPVNKLCYLLRITEADEGTPRIPWADVASARWESLSGLCKPCPLYHQCATSLPCSLGKRKVSLLR